jgi:hypothetical protein
MTFLNAPLKRDDIRARSALQRDCVPALVGNLPESHRARTRQGLYVRASHPFWTFCDSAPRRHVHRFSVESTPTSGRKQSADVG